MSEIQTFHGVKGQSLTLKTPSFTLKAHVIIGGLAEELGTALQKLLRGCEALTHLQIISSIVENQAKALAHEFLS